MTLIETFVGSSFEALSICCLLNLFNSRYLGSKFKVFIVVVTIAIITTATDALLIPIGYLINYITFIFLLSIVMRVKIVSVFFEFIFSLATIAVTQILVIYITSAIVNSDKLGMIESLVDLTIILIICYSIGMNKKLQLRVVSFYLKYYEQIYLITVNLFVFAIIELYYWDTSSKHYIEETGFIIAFAVIWCMINVYILKKLIENHKEKEKNLIHEQYIEMSENLLSELYAEKHEFKKHLQTIEGLIHTNDPCNAVSNIESYITNISDKAQEKENSQAYFHTEDSVVNALLFSKYKDAERNQINLKYVPSDIFPKFPCEKYELIEIIGNLIDNAFDFVMTLEPQERKVLISIENKNGQKSIMVRNNYYTEVNNNLELMTKKGYSTKAGNRRGYGLYNVKSITSKHSGKLNIFRQDNQLVVQVLF